MTYPITVSLIPGLPVLPYRNGVGNYEGVVAHATANYNDTAAGERNYESGHYQDAFVHFFVDHTSIIQDADVNHIAWGAGPVANQRYVHVELCQTYDAGQFQESYNRYVWLLAKLLHDKNLGVSRGKSFWTHHDVTNLLGGTTHQDPDAYLASHGVSIDKLVADISGQYDEMSKVAAASISAPKPAASAPVVSKSIDELAQEVIAGKLGSGEARKAALGSQYDAVQKRVTELLAPPKRTGVVKVLVSDLRVRTGPGTNYPVIESKSPLPMSEFKFYDVQNDWYEVTANEWAYGNNGQYLKEV